MKICGVCGDKALGYNFNALTCESCKAFFRRNALRNKNFSCVSGNKCELDPKTRKYCRKCRLDKCFEIGMKKEWILTAEEKLTKRRKHRHIEINDPDSSCNVGGSVRYSTDNSLINEDSNSKSTNSTNLSTANIIILPIFSSTCKNKDNGQILEDFMKNLNKKSLVDFVNDKLKASSNENIIIVDNTIKDNFNNLQSTSKMVDTNINNNNNNNNNNSELEQLPQITQLSSFEVNNNDYFNCYPTNFSYDQSYQPSLSPNETINFNSQPTIHSLESQQSSSTPLISNPDPIIDNFTFEDYNSEMPNNIRSEPILNIDNSAECNNFSDLLMNFDNSKNTKNNEWKISRNVYEHALNVEYMTENLRTDSKQLSPTENERLDELKRTFQPLYREINDQNYQRKIVNNIEEGFKFLEEAIKLIINVIKKIRAFKNLCSDDQLALMKGSITKIRSLLNLRLISLRDEMFSVPHPQDNNSVLVFDKEYFRLSYGDHLFAKCQKFVSSFRDDWKSDESIINLLIMIMTFYPNRPDVQHREYITLEYISYCHLLRRYLEIKYQSICEARSVYINLLSRMEELNYFSEKCIETIIMKFNPKYIGPLTYEVWNLGQKLKQN